VDWQSILSDAAIVSSVGAAIFAVLNVVKRIWKSLPWSWAKNTPGEVWWGLSVAMAVGVAFAVYWDNFFGPEATIGDGISTMAYSLLGGAGSNLLSSVSSTAGANLKASKLEARAKIANGNGGGAPVVKVDEQPIITPEEPAEVSTLSTHTESVSTEPLIKPTVVNERLPERKQPVDKQVYLLKAMEPPEGYFVLSGDGEFFKLHNGKLKHLPLGYAGGGQ